MDNRPIGLFDSGVGGLSVLAQIKKILPEETCIFLADQANVPYGAKTKTQLKKLTKRLTEFLLNYDIKVLVVACNTASCYTIDYLRDTFSIPIIGVVPAVKTAAEMAANSKIAVMSTPATAKSSYLKNLIKKVAPNTKVLRIGCAGLEEAVEYLKLKATICGCSLAWFKAPPCHGGDRGSKSHRPRFVKLNEISDLLGAYINRIKNFGAEVIVLGCTHYPFLKKDIEKIAGSDIKVIDSGKAVANRLFSILKEKNMLSGDPTKDIFFTTGDPRLFSKVASTLLQYNISSQKAVV